MVDYSRMKDGEIGLLLGAGMARSNAAWAGFDVSKRLVFETRYWMVLVRQTHITLGSCNVLLKRRARSVRDLAPREFRDLLPALSRYEALLQRVFEPTKFYYAISGQSNPHFHLHAIPRYDSDSIRMFANMQWVDPDWPYFPDFPRDPIPTDDWVLDEVTTRLQARAGGGCGGCFHREFSSSTIVPRI